MANLPADLPEDWTSNQKISPNGTEVGLSEQHGYNYLMKQVNDAQNEINNIGTTIEEALTDVAKEASVQEIITSIGETDDTGGSTTAGTVMGKLNNIQANTDGLNDNLAYLNSTIDSDNPVPIDVLMTQLLYGTVFEYSKPGTYQLLIPANVSRIKVTACGAGGGGAGRWSDGDASCGGGGGGDAIVEQEYEVTPQSTLNITIGKGGTAGGSTRDNDNGGDGGATIIGNLVTLAGGHGGTKVAQGVGLGGEAGGSGGGSGGNGYYLKSAGTFSAKAGADGILGKGGLGGTWSEDSFLTSKASSVGLGGGGGGSIGAGGVGQSAYINSNGIYTTRGGTKGAKGSGGGAAACIGGSLNGDAQPGGDGYAKIELIITP